MRFILKLLAAPFALALTLTAALCSLAVVLSNKVLGIVSGLVFLVAIALFFTGQTTGGAAWLAIAIVLSLLSMVAGWLVGKLEGAGGALTAFIFS